jgi:hypothetical protein
VEAATVERVGGRGTVATALAGILAADALCHLYWSTGATWPAADTAALSRAVMNADVPFTPPVLLPLVGLLGGASLLVLARGAVVRLPLPAAVPRWTTRAVAAGLSVRAAAGLVWATGPGTPPDSAFHLLNAALYTPVCVVGAAAAWWLAHD